MTSNYGRGLYKEFHAQLTCLNHKQKWRFRIIKRFKQYKRDIDTTLILQAMSISHKNNPYKFTHKQLTIDVH